MQILVVEHVDGRVFTAALQKKLGELAAKHCEVLSVGYARTEKRYSALVVFLSPIQLAGG